MTKEQLKDWLSTKQFGTVILICPRCKKVDINPKTHLDKCDPQAEAYRQQNQEYYD